MGAYPTQLATKQGSWMNALYQRTGNVASIPRIQTTGCIVQSLKPTSGMDNWKCGCKVTEWPAHSDWIRSPPTISHEHREVILRGIKQRESEDWPVTSIWCSGLERTELYLRLRCKPSKRGSYRARTSALRHILRHRLHSAVSSMLEQLICYHYHLSSPKCLCVWFSIQSFVKISCFAKSTTLFVMSDV